MVTNNNRKIQLYLASENDTSNASWRHNFTRILEAQRKENNSEKFSQLFNSFDNNMNASDSIDLLMLSAPKTPATNNAFDKPVDKFLSTLSSINVIGAISSIAEQGINVLSVYNDIGGGKESINRTARVFQPWTKNVKAWSGSQGGITFEHEFKFNLGQYGLWNAKEEVVKPILNLVAPAFPQYLNNMSMAGPFPGVAELLYRLVENTDSSNIADTISDIGESFSSIGADNTETTGTFDKIKNAARDIAGSIDASLARISDFLATVITGAFKQFTYNLEFGNIVKFKNMIITQAKTSFSNEVDQNGFPISGSATLTFEGLVPQALTYDIGFGEIQMFKYGSN